MQAINTTNNSGSTSTEVNNSTPKIDSSSNNTLNLDNTTKIPDQTTPKIDTGSSKTSGDTTETKIKPKKDKYPHWPDNTRTKLPERQDKKENRFKFSSMTPLNDGFSDHPENVFELPAEGDLFFYWQLIPYERTDATKLNDTGSKTKYEKMRVGIEKRNTGWSSVGWGPHMFEGEVLLLEREDKDKNTLYASECTLIGYAVPKCRKLKEFTIIHQEFTASSHYVEFEYKFGQPGSLFERFIRPDKEQYLEWAQTPDRGNTKKHKGVGTFGLAVVNFSNNQIYKHMSNYNWIVWFHVWGLMFVWTVGVDFLILWGRYAKSIKYYYEIHSWGMGSLMILSLVATFYMVFYNTDRGALYTYPGHRTNGPAHFWIGMIISLQIIFQAVGGWFLRRKMVIAKFEGLGFKVQTFRLVHLFMGLFIWALARVQLFIGKDYVYDLYTRYTMGKGFQFRPSQIFLYVETPFIILIFIGLEFIFWLRSGALMSRDQMLVAKQKVTSSSKDKETHKQIVDCLNSSMLRSELDRKFPDKIIMMFLNRIYDLTDFTHPGGQYIWEWSRWRETSRYLIGAYGDEKDYYDYMPYTHSKDAYKMLEKTFLGK